MPTTMTPSTRARYPEPALAPPPTTALPPLPQGPPPTEPPSLAPVSSSSLGRSSSSSMGARPSARPAITTSQSSHQPPQSTAGPPASRRSRSSSIIQPQGYQLAPAATTAAPNGASAPAAAADSSRTPFTPGPSHPSSLARTTAAPARSHSESSSNSTKTFSPTAAAPGAGGGGGPPPRTPSRTLLQQALTLAQQAVLLDQESQFVEALDVYRTTVGLLEKVMERVEAGERKRRERGQSTSGGAGEEEGRTLRGIYEAYTSRIALLSEQLDADETPLSSPALSSTSHPYQSYPSSYASANRAHAQDASAPSSAAPSVQYRTDLSSVYDGIGSAMLSSSASSMSLASNSATVGAGGFHRPRPPSQMSVSSSHSRNQSYSAPSAPSSATTEFGSAHRPRSNSRSLGPAPPPPAGPPPPPPPSASGSTAPSSHRTSLLSNADGAEADQRRQSLLDSLELSLGPAGGRKLSSAGLLLEGVAETPEGGEAGSGLSRPSTETMEVLDRTPLQPDFGQAERGRDPPAGADRSRLGKTPVVLETSEGTISQRRKAGAGALPDLHISGGSSTRSSSIDLERGGMRTAPPEPSISSSSASSSTPSPTPPLSSDSQLSLPQSAAPKEKSGMFRLRALSQPGRRPSLASNGDGGQATPPVPVIQRKASFPANPLGTGGTSPGRTLAPFGIGRSSSSAGVGSVPTSGSLRSTSARSAASSREAFDHYPPVPPSPSFSIHSPYAALGAGRARPPAVGTPANQSPSPEAIPANLVQRPFHLMRLLRATMVTPGGAYLTKRMHVSAETWTLAGVHLQAVDAKVEAIQQLADGLQALERAGAPFLDPAAPAAKVQDQGRDWARALDGFERTIDDVQVALGKKLNMEFGGHVKAKSSGTSLMGFGNKLTRVMEKKFANGRNVHNVYVDDLSRLFAQVQFIDEHLKYFTAGAPPSAAYLALAAAARSHVEQRLRRVSEFFGQVVVVVVLRDLGLLMDKYAKSVDKWLMD